MRRLDRAVRRRGVRVRCQRAARNGGHLGALEPREGKCGGVGAGELVHGRVPVDGPLRHRRRPKGARSRVLVDAAVARLGRRKSLPDDPMREVPCRHSAPGAQRDIEAVGRAGDALVHPVSAHDGGPVADGELGAREADGDVHLLAPLGGADAEEEVAAAALPRDHVEARVVLATDRPGTGLAGNNGRLGSYPLASHLNSLAQNEARQSLFFRPPTRATKCTSVRKDPSTTSVPPSS